MRGPWKLAQLDAAPRLGLRVVSTFSGGGGSSMGYRLAGLDVIAAVEIDPEMTDRYETNLGAGKAVRAPVGDVARWTDVELEARFGAVDILDGSPPCSSFSMAGSREGKWGEAHKFREGQATQRLDSLFLDFVELARRLRPRVVVGENVMGMLIGKARGFVLEVRDAFLAASYEPQLFQLDASRMGVPQRRKRIVFVARRLDLGMPPLSLAFDESWISAREAFEGCAPRAGEKVIWLTERHIGPWGMTRPGRALSEVHSKGHLWNWQKIDPDSPTQTLTASAVTPLHWSEPRHVVDAECVRMQTFPDDYDFGSLPARYVCGMSVPPQMMRRVATAIASWMGA